MDSKLFTGNGGTEPRTPLAAVLEIGTHAFDPTHLKSVKSAVSSLNRLIEKLEGATQNHDHVLTKQLIQVRHAIETGPLAVLRGRRERSGRETA